MILEICSLLVYFLLLAACKSQGDLWLGANGPLSGTATTAWTVVFSLKRSRPPVLSNSIFFSCSRYSFNFFVDVHLRSSEKVSPRFRSFNLTMFLSWSRLSMPFALLHLLSVVSAQSEIPVVTLPPPMVLSITVAQTELASTPPTTTLSTSPSPTNTPAEAKVHLVKVGAGGFKFEPAELTDVAVGDIVSFEFYPPDHSVARADFNSPCMPYEYTGRDRKGFFSKVQMVNTINDVSLRGTVQRDTNILLTCVVDSL